VGLVADKIVAAYPQVGAALAEKIVEVAARLKANPYDLANLINFETGGRFTSDVRNPSSGATGLIQFMPETAKNLGTTVAALARLSPVEQMAWVEKYFRTSGVSPLSTAQRLFMAVFYPAAARWPLDKAFSATVQKWNPGIRTVRDYIQKALAHARLPSDAAETIARGEDVTPGAREDPEVTQTPYGPVPSYPMPRWIKYTAVGVASILSLWLVFGGRRSRSRED